MRYPLPVLAFSLCASLSLHAQSFTTNPNFGTNGTTLVNLYNKTTDDFVASGINVTPDGHVLVGGSVYFDACVNTLSPEGIDDVRYGVKGWSFYDFGGWFNNTVHDILRTPDGKTVLIGSQEPCISMDDRYNTDEGAAVMRLLPDGSPDPSFGIAGKAMIFYSGWTIVTFSGLVQPDGKIVLLCRGESGGSGGVWARLMLVRIDANGRPDSSFGVNGIALIPQFSGDDHYLLAGNSGIALQADGKIVVGDLITDQIWINYGVGSNTGPAVYRYNPNGVPDSTFGVNGVYSNHLSFYSYGINGVLVQSDGHIVVSAAIIDSVTRNNTGWLLFRLDSSGKKLDSSFANNGLFTYTPDSAGNRAAWTTAAAGTLLQQPGGNLVVSAVHATTSGNWLDVFRLTPSGRWDTTFAHRGVVLSQPVNVGHILSCSKIVADTAGNLAVLGYSGPNGFAPNQDPNGYLVARLTKDGALLHNFGTNGLLLYTGGKDSGDTTNFNFGSLEELSAMCGLGSGGILLAGYYRLPTTGIVENGNYMGNVLVGLTSAGRIDSSFGIQGQLILPNHAQGMPVRTILQLAQGEVIVNEDDHTLLRLRTNGHIDSSWGNNGTVTISNGTYRLRAVLEQPDQKLLVLSDAQLNRLNADGSPDNSFGTQGLLMLSYYFGVGATTMHLQPDGQIVVGANVTAAPAYTYLFRCSASGVPDRTFGLDGSGYAQVLVNIPAAYELPYANIFKDFQILPNGDFIVLSMKDRTGNAGTYPPGTSWPQLTRQVLAAGAHFRDFMVFRLTPDGKIDSSFGGYPDTSVYKGTTHLFLPYLENVPATINVDTSTGKLLLSGLFDRGTGWDAGFVSLTPNGLYDTTCAVPGVATLNMDNIIFTSRFALPDLSVYTQRLPDGTYLFAGTREGQGPDLFIKDVYPPNTPAANYSKVEVTQDTACLMADVSWQAAQDCSVDSFVVEHSSDNVTYTRLGAIAAGASGNYSLSPVGAAYGPNYYRIRSSAAGVVYGGSPAKELLIDSSKVARITWAHATEQQQDSLFDLQLNWNTSAEDGATAFQVQQATDTINFRTIGSMTPDGGDFAAGYTFDVDHLAPGSYYFRILASGTDCRTTTSPLLFVPLTTSSDSCGSRFMAWPNPVHSELTVVIPDCATGDLFLTSIYSQTLQIIHHPTGKVIIDFAGYNPGLYFLKFVAGKPRTLKILKL